MTDEMKSPDVITPEGRSGVRETLEMKPRILTHSDFSVTLVPQQDGSFKAEVTLGEGILVGFDEIQTDVIVAKSPAWSMAGAGKTEVEAKEMLVNLLQGQLGAVPQEVAVKGLQERGWVLQE